MSRYKYSPNADGVEKLAQDVESIFTEENFPGVDAGYLDAASHFYGQAYATKKYGYALARTAGIYNEARGHFMKGHTINATRADFENNKRGRNYFLENDEAETYLNLLEEGIIDGPENMRQTAKDSLINNAINHTVYAPMAVKIDDMSDRNRYSMDRILKFVEEAW